MLVIARRNGISQLGLFPYNDHHVEFLGPQVIETDTQFFRRIRRNILHLLLLEWTG